MADVLLTRGQVAGQAIAGGGGVYDLGDVYCGGDSTLLVLADMTGAADADLDIAVLPFEADNATVQPIALQPDTQVGPELSGGHVYTSQSYNVVGFEKVRVRLINNNAGAQTITRASWRLQ